jgi:integrase
MGDHDDGDPSKGLSSPPRAVRESISNDPRIYPTAKHMTNIDLLIGRCRDFDPGFEHNVKQLVNAYRDLGRSERTIDTYVRALRLIAENYGKDPADWTRDDQDAFILLPWFKGLSKSSKDTHVSVLKAYWDQLWRKDMLDHPTFFKARKARGEGRDKASLKRLSLPQPDVEAVIRECRLQIREGNDLAAYRHFPLLLQACFGIRNIGVSHLRACDIRLNERYIHVVEDKGGKTHDVPIDVDVREEYDIFMAARERVVRNLRTRCAGQDVMCFAKLDDLLAPDGPLFFKRDPSKGTAGERLDENTLGKMTGRLASRIVGRRVNAHMFRHSKIFYLFEVKGLTAHQVAKYIGHDNINTTYSYLDMGTDELHDALGTGKALVDPAPAPSPSGGSDFESKVRKLKALKDQGIISAEDFNEQLARLL